MTEVASPSRTEEPLVAFLREYSLTSTPRRLLWHTLAGVLQVAGTLWSMPTAWLPLTLGGVCLTAYGVWSYVDMYLETAAPETTSAQTTSAQTTSLDATSREPSGPTSAEIAVESAALPSPHRWALIRTLTAALGVTAAFGTLLTGASLLLGRWMS